MELIKKSILEKISSKLGNIEHKIHHPLAKYTSFKVGGTADIFVCPKNLTQLQQILLAANFFNLPYFILGGGSNLLISDHGIRGFTIKLKGDFLKVEKIPKKKQIITGASTPFPLLTKKALSLGWQSALGWSGTPGQVGGALLMNAGTKQGTIGNVVKEVWGVDNKGSIKHFKKSDIKMSYRKSNFPKGMILTKALLQSPTQNENNAEIFIEKVKELGKVRANSQPKSRCAGCIFKNPKNSTAGKLLDECNMKGVEIGGAKVSLKHANFIINKNNATAKDILSLSKLMQERVFAKFDILLKYEIKLAGFFL